jgi:hypothetical protein
MPAVDGEECGPHSGSTEGAGGGCIRGQLDELPHCGGSVPEQWHDG